MARSGQASVEVLADFSKFAAAFQRDLNTALRGVNVDMSGISNQMSKGIRDGVNAANDEFKRLGQQVGDSYNLITNQSKVAGRNVAASFTAAGRAMASTGDQMALALSLPLAAVGTQTVLTAASFEKSMNRVKAVSGATAEEFAKLRSQAIDLGSTTQYSASQAADAMGYLSMAGFTAEQTYQALPGVLNLAAAGAVELGDAADIASNILSGYGYAASDIGRVNDVLAKTFTSTNTTLMSLGETFKYVGPVAASAGVSFEEISAAIGLMGNAGIQGSEAGTALRGAIARLLKPTAEVSTALKDLGVKVVDSQGTLLPLVDIVKQLESAGADTADMMTIFGLEAGPAMQALVSQGSAALRTLSGDLQNAGGTADRVATTQMEGFSGAWASLTSAVEGFMIAIGDSGVLQDLTTLVQSVTAWVSALSQTNPQLLKAAVYFGVFVAALGPVLAIAGRLVSSIGTVIKVVKSIGAAFKFVAAAAGFATGTFAVVAIAIAAIVGALVWAYFHFQKFRDVCDQVFRAVASGAMWLWNNAIKPAFAYMIGMFTKVGAYLAKLWSSSWLPAIKGMGKSVMDAWNGQIRPALVELGAAFRRLGSTIAAWWTGGGREAFSNAARVISWWWSNVTLPAIKGVVAILAVLGYAIYWAFKNVTIPLIAAVVKTITFFVNAWNRLMNAAKPVTQFLNAAFTRIAAVISWWWNNVTVPAFKGFMVAVRAVWAVVQFLWQVAVTSFTAIAAVVTFFWNVASVVFGAVASAIGAVVSVVQWFWGTFGPLWTAIGQLVWAVWSGVFSIVFALMKAGFSIIATAVQLWWSIFTAAWSAVAAVLMAVWNGIIWPALQAVGAAFAWLWNNAISPALSAVGSAFSWLWGVAKTVWDAIASAVQSAVGRVVSVASRVAAFASAVIGFFTSAVNGVREKVESMVSVASSIPGRIVSAIGNLGSLLYNAGQNVINGLINGITSRIGALASKVSEAAATIRDHLPFSPAKVGPLSGAGDPTIAGGVIVDMIADGMEDNIRRISAATSDIASEIQDWVPATRSGMSAVIGDGAVTVPTITLPTRTQQPGATAAARPGTTYNITVNSLDPRSAGKIVVESIKTFEKTNGKGWRA